MVTPRTTGTPADQVLSIFSGHLKCSQGEDTGRGRKETHGVGLCLHEGEPHRPPESHQLAQRPWGRSVFLEHSKGRLLCSSHSGDTRRQLLNSDGTAGFTCQVRGLGLLGAVPEPASGSASRAGCCCPSPDVSAKGNGSRSGCNLAIHPRHHAAGIPLPSAHRNVVKELQGPSAPGLVGRRRWDSDHSPPGR